MNPEMAAARASLAAILSQHPETRGLDLRVHGSNLILSRTEIYRAGEKPVRDDRTRLTRLSGNEYGLSVMRHNGRWERTPFTGTLGELVDIMRSLMPHLLAPMGISDAD